MRLPFHLPFRLLAILVLIAACAGVTAADAPGVRHVETEKAFDQLIAASAGSGAVVVVDFHAEWCGPCKVIGPELEKLAAANPGKVEVIKIDIDKAPALAQRFKVEAIPLLIQYRGGKEVGRKLGALSQDALREWVAPK